MERRFLKENLFEEKNDDVVDYHNHDYLSASSLKSLLDRKIYNKQSTSMDFGTQVHWMIEQAVKNKKVRFIKKDRTQIAGQAVNGEYADVINTEAKLVDLKAIYGTWKVWRMQAGKLEDGVAEMSFYISHQAIKEAKIPEYLQPLHDFILSSGKGIKCRPDYLHGVTSYDWKTISPIDGSLDTYSKTYGFTRDYFLSNIFYHYVFCVMGKQVPVFKTVFLTKEKRTVSPVELTCDFSCGGVQVQTLMKLQGMLMDMNYEYLDKIQKMCNGNKTIKITYKGD